MKWVLVLIAIHCPDGAWKCPQVLVVVDGVYESMADCFEARDVFLPGHPPVNGQAVCVRSDWIEA